MSEPFTTYKGKIRKSGSGCIYKINDHLYNGKRVKHNVYSQSLVLSDEIFFHLLVELPWATFVRSTRFTGSASSFFHQTFGSFF